jgi:UDP-glucose 4-epimerase
MTPPEDAVQRSRRRRALITGGAGFIGSHLAETLLARGDRVAVIDDLSTGTLDNIKHLVDRPNFTFAVDTVKNAVVMDRLASEADIIYHLAAAVGVRLIVEQPAHVIEANVLGTHAVLEAALRYRTTVVLASTSELYGKNAKLPFNEADDRLMGPTTIARWSYAESKAVDEFMALAYHRQYDLPVVIARLFNTVGPRQTGQYGMVVPRFVRQALDGERLTVHGDGHQSRCFCNVADAVRALVALGDQEAALGQIVNVGTTEEITILDLARTILALVDGDAPSDDARIEFVPYAEAYVDGFEDMRRRIPDITRAGELIGWRPEISLDTTLRSVVDHLRGGAR